MDEIEFSDNYITARRSMKQLIIDIPSSKVIFQYIDPRSIRVARFYSSRPVKSNFSKNLEKNFLSNARSILSNTYIRPTRTIYKPTSSRLPKTFIRPLVDFREDKTKPIYSRESKRNQPNVRYSRAKEQEHSALIVRANNIHFVQRSRISSLYPPKEPSSRLKLTKTDG